MISNSVQMLTHGLKVTDFMPTDSNEEVDIVIRFDKAYRTRDELDKIFIEGIANSIPESLVKQLKDDGEIFVTLKNQEYVGDFVRALKIESNISIEKYFNTNVKDKIELLI